MKTLKFLILLSILTLSVSTSKAQVFGNPVTFSNTVTSANFMTNSYFLSVPLKSVTLGNVNTNETVVFNYYAPLYGSNVLVGSATNTFVGYTNTTFTTNLFFPYYTITVPVYMSVTVTNGTNTIYVP